MSRRAGGVLGALLLVVVCNFGVFAQSERGTISGTVLDSSGASIPGARVTVTNSLTNVTSTTESNEAGIYIVPSLQAGPYSVRIEKDGFKPYVQTGLTVNAATTARLDITLDVGTSQQTVEVTANAQLLSTESAKTSVTVTNKLVDELPLVVGGTLRSPFDLAALTPEAKNIGGDDGFILGGGQAAGYGATLDGISANTTRALQLSWVSSNAPSLEAVTEFTVDTNGFKAEYGHASGGVMTFSSKSGTNSLHGSVYEFLRNNDLDANRFFSNRGGLPRAIYKQHDFGFSVGGPVWLPKIYNGKDKTFFFFAYEGFRNRQGATAFTTTVPTPEMYTGDFSRWVDSSGKVIPIYDPTTQVIDPTTGAVTRTQFPNNQIPKNLFDPFVQKAIGVFQTSGQLVPNTGAAPGTVGYVNNNFTVANGSQVAPINKFSIKGDHIFSTRDRISGYYGYDREYLKPGADGPSTLPGLYTTYNDLRQFTDVFRMSWDHTFSPTKLNHFYAGGNNWVQDHKSPQEYIGHWKDKICLGNVPDCDDNLVIFNFSTGYGSWGGPGDNGSENTIYGFNDDFTWIRGKHSFKFGGMYQLSHYNGFGRETAGRVGFSFTETGRGGDTNFATAGGNPFASALIGWADNGRIDTIRFIGQQWPYFAGYFQDDWRVNTKLTLNLGIRWETQLPPTGLNDSWSDFSPTRPNPAANNIPGALIYAGTGTGREGSRRLADSYYRAFGPHVGFAYTLDAKTVVRGSYALSYGAITTVTGSTHQRGFTLIYQPSNGSNGVQPTFIVSQGFPAWKAPPFIDPSFSNGDSMPWWQGREATRPPENHNFNFSIQRQLTPSTVLEASYNAVIGTHLQANLLNYDQVNPAYLNTLGTALLNSQIDSPAAIAAGLTPPFPGFKALWGSRATVAQALRAYPQYNGIDTAGGGGDHSGHSSYHAGILRLEKRYSNGLQFQTSYVFSKIITDADSYWSTDFPAAANHFNRRLEKSIGAFDVTHNFKLGLVYELPFGKGKRMLNHGVAAAALGGWRIGSIHFYSSGTPIALGTSYTLPLFAGRNIPYVTSYDGWRAPTAGGSFDPSVDNFLVPYKTGPFPEQGTPTTPNGFGNVTRYNPKARQFPNYNENISVAKSFPIRENMRVDFRAEAFNAFNRVRFGTGSTQLQSQSFGRLTSNSDLLNTPRQMQLALKLYW